MLLTQLLRETDNRMADGTLVPPTIVSKADMWLKYSRSQSFLGDVLQGVQATRLAVYLSSNNTL